MNHDEYIPELNDVYEKYGIRGVRELVLDCKIENQPEYLFDIANIMIFFHNHNRMDIFFTVMKYENSAKCLIPVLDLICESEDVSLLDFFKLKRIHFIGIEFDVLLYLVGNNHKKHFLYYFRNQKIDVRRITLIFRQFSISHIQKNKYHSFYFRKMIDKLLKYPTFNVMVIFKMFFANYDYACLYLLLENYNLKFNLRKKYEIYCKIDRNVKDYKSFKEYIFDKLPNRYQEKILEEKRMWA